MGEFLYWYYSRIPRLILEVGQGYWRRVYYGFSIPILGQTLLAPWRRDIEDATNQSLGDQVRVLIDNLVSRLFGAVVRLATLAVGYLTLIFTILAGVVIELFWLGLPFVIVLLIGGGIRILIGGAI